MSDEINKFVVSNANTKLWSVWPSEEEKQVTLWGDSIQVERQLR